MSTRRLALTASTTLILGLALAGATGSAHAESAGFDLCMLHPDPGTCGPGWDPNAPGGGGGTTPIPPIGLGGGKNSGGGGGGGQSYDLGVYYLGATTSWGTPVDRYLIYSLSGGPVTWDMATWAKDAWGMLTCVPKDTGDGECWAARPAPPALGAGT